jgi:hypothetical protein
MHKYPTRSTSHVLEELSERYLRDHLPRTWTLDRPSKDYGVDCRIDIFELNKATGLELLIQLKASQRASARTYESVRLRTTTYNYLWDKLQIVMLIKYVNEEREAYWLLLRDVPEPKQTGKSFQVRIPKANTLRTIDWENIAQHIRRVTDEKLATRRRCELTNERAMT